MLYRLALIIPLACGSGAPPGDAPYDGPPAYPNRRAPLELPAGEIGFVTNSYSDTVDVVELATLRRIRTFPIGRIPYDMDGPHHLRIHEASDSIYVPLTYPNLRSPASTGPHSEHGTGTHAGYIQRFALSDFRDLGAVRVDESPGDIAVSDDGRRVVVTHFDLARGISKGIPIDERRSSIVSLDSPKNFESASVPVVRTRMCRAMHGVVLSPGSGNIAYAACYLDDAMVRMDLVTKIFVVKPLGTALSTADAPEIGPYAVSMPPSAKLLAVTTTPTKDLRYLSTETLEPTMPPTPLGGAGYFPAWSPDERLIYVPTQGEDGLRIVDVATGKLLQQRVFSPAECEKPHDVHLSRDGKRLYVVCEGDHAGVGALVSMDTTSLEVTGRMTLGVYPDRLAVVVRP
ncbi:MAG: LpqB family beta-propeller domain-containing protein [Polyangiaceae bacterium]